MVTSITSGRLVGFKKTVWLGIKLKHEKKCSSLADVVIGHPRRVIWSCMQIYYFAGHIPNKMHHFSVPFASHTYSCCRGV